MLIKMHSAYLDDLPGEQVVGASLELAEGELLDLGVQLCGLDGDLAAEAKGQGREKYQDG